MEWDACLAPFAFIAISFFRVFDSVPIRIPVGWFSTNPIFPIACLTFRIDKSIFPIDKTFTADCTHSERGRSDFDEFHFPNRLFYFPNRQNYFPDRQTFHSRLHPFGTGSIWFRRISWTDYMNSRARPYYRFDFFDKHLKSHCKAAFCEEMLKKKRNVTIEKNIRWKWYLSVFPTRSPKYLGLSKHPLQRLSHSYSFNSMCYGNIHERQATILRNENRIGKRMSFRSKSR